MTNSYSWQICSWLLDYYKCKYKQQTGTCSKSTYHRKNCIQALVKKRKSLSNEENNEIHIGIFVDVLQLKSTPRIRINAELKPEWICVSNTCSRKTRIHTHEHQINPIEFMRNKEMHTIISKRNLIRHTNSWNKLTGARHTNAWSSQFVLRFLYLRHKHNMRSNHCDCIRYVDLNRFYDNSSEISVCLMVILFVCYYAYIDTCYSVIFKFKVKYFILMDLDDICRKYNCHFVQTF